MTDVILYNSARFTVAYGRGVLRSWVQTHPWLGYGLAILFIFLCLVVL